MDWFRPVLGSLALLSLTLAFFFAAPVLQPVVIAIQSGGPVAIWSFTVARIALLLLAAYGIARATGRGQAPAAIALVVAAPTLVVGGLMGVAAALQPVHLVIVAALAAGVLAAAWLGARQGAAR